MQRPRKNHQKIYPVSAKEVGILQIHRQTHQLKKKRRKRKRRTKKKKRTTTRKCILKRTDILQVKMKRKKKRKRKKIKRKKNKIN